MDGIVAAAFLVRCASNLLLCEDLPALPSWFADMEACRAALPNLIEEHGSQEGRLPMVMGKCSLMIRPGPSTASVIAGSLR